MIRDIYSGSGFFPIPDPGVKKVGTGSRILNLNTEKLVKKKKNVEIR
jgi:hypothetical protein